MKNIIDDLLDYLDIKHTNHFVNKLYNEHPHKENMYGLKDMLRYYNIESIGVNVKDKNDAKMYFPSIYHVGKDFILAIDRKGKEISLLVDGKIETSNIDTFKHAWDGNTLIITSTENAREKDYHYNLGLEWITKLSWGYLLLCPFALLVILLFYHPIVSTILNVPVIFLLTTGCFLCYLLLQKKLKEDNSLGDKFCSMITEKGCDAVLASQKSIILYLYSWSEIGLAYFVTNLMILSFAPYFMSGLIFVNYIAMAYGLWSVWYQAVKVQKWCTLCLTVQLVIWLLGLYYSILLYNGLMVLSSVWVSLSVVSLSFAMAIVTVHFVVKSYGDNHIITLMSQKLKKFQVDNDVLVAKYMKENGCSDLSNGCTVFWGNPNAMHQIIIVLNPHCSHCVKMFKKIEPLMRKDNLRLGIHLVFLSFGAEYDDTCKLLIAAYQQMGKEKALDLFYSWFDDISQDVGELIEMVGLDINHENVQHEYEQHIHWTSKNNIKKTPYVLVNGHVLPSVYEIEDLEEMDEI